MRSAVGWGEVGFHGLLGCFARRGRFVAGEGVWAMSMVDCHECGESISSDALRCPKCGAGNKRGTYIFFALLAFVALLVTPMCLDLM